MKALAALVAALAMLGSAVAQQQPPSKPLAHELMDSAYGVENHAFRDRAMRTQGCWPECWSWARFPFAQADDYGRFFTMLAAERYGLDVEVSVEGFHNIEEVCNDTTEGCYLGYGRIAAKLGTVFNGEPSEHLATIVVIHELAHVFDDEDGTPIIHGQAHGAEFYRWLSRLWALLLHWDLEPYCRAHGADCPSGGAS